MRKKKWRYRKTPILTTCGGCVRVKRNGNWRVKQCKYCKLTDRLLTAKELHTSESTQAVIDQCLGNIKEMRT